MDMPMNIDDDNIQQLLDQLESLRTDIRDLKSIQQAQQESITSLIALCQQQTGVIEQQTMAIQRLVGGSSI